MSRCPFYDQSKYTLKPKKKQCKSVATVKAVFPISPFAQSMADGYTKISIVWICAAHNSLIQFAKANMLRHWKERDAAVMKLLDNSDVGS